jgi:Pyrimidine dimer DNA glycosylase
MVDPTLMCRQHLLGEHVECHMFRGSILKGKSLRGFLETGLLDSRQLAHRHDELAEEMGLRGYRHASPLPSDFNVDAAVGDVNLATSMQELASRCPSCRQLQSQRSLKNRRADRDTPTNR